MTDVKGTLKTFGGGQLWGIMGGMGPLSSAEFVKTIYGLRPEDREQAAPHLILWSDPRSPDRTECILEGRPDLLLEPLTENLRRLAACEVTSIVICCVTIHHLMDMLPAALRSKVISLVDLIFEVVLRSERRYLLLCTKGTRKVELFERHPLWERTHGRIVLPSDDDQEKVHELVYRVKRGLHCPADVEFLGGLVAAYGADSFIAGCTEIHVLVREYGLAHDRARGCPCLDPLMVLAELISQSALHVPANLEPYRAGEIL
jgi:aspartate racemase